MIIIPAIDLMNGCCVRLSQGKFDTQTIYSENPLETAKQFEATGFTHLHMVDLDGARQKKPVHFEVLNKVTSNTKLKIDFSGGIRSIEQAAEVFENGAYAITIGSLAVNEPDICEDILNTFGAEKIILGADVKNGFIATAGWQEQSEYDIYSFLEQWYNKGFSKVMITDVSKDGMMEGPSVELYQNVMERFPTIKLIASGGIASMEDLIQLNEAGCYGAITGKALYENSININQLKNFLKQ